MDKLDQESLTPTQLAWKRFRANRLAVFGLGIIIFAFLIATLGANIRPDATQHANSQQLSLASKGINFSVQMLLVKKNDPPEQGNFFGHLFFGGKPSDVLEIPLHSYRFSGDSIVGFAYGGEAHIQGRPFAFHLADAAFAIDENSLSSSGDTYTFTDHDGQSLRFNREELEAKVLAESVITRRFVLGTDKFGRDMLSRLMAGTIVSFSVGLISVLISLVLGIGLGAVAGYFGGWIDDVITWLINVVWSIPTLLLVIAITFALGKGFVQVFVAVGLTMWVEVARVVRGQVLSVRGLEYIEAARALGYSSFRIITRHVIPNVMGPVVVISAANFASAILLEAGLSFLGIGAQIPMASWGQMIKEHYPYITTSMAYLAVLPGLCIVTLVLAFMLVGNGLRDSLDTRAEH